MNLYIYILFLVGGHVCTYIFVGACAGGSQRPTSAVTPHELSIRNFLRQTLLLESEMTLGETRLVGQ